MGQQEVIDILDKNWRNPKWWTAKEIVKKLNISPGCVTMSLKKLRNTNFIFHRSASVNRRERYEYRSKKGPI